MHQDIRFGSARHWGVWLFGVAFGFAVGVMLGIMLSPMAHACDPGSFYDPNHAICQGTPPSAPGYEQPPSNHPYPRHYYPGYGGGQ